MKSYLHLMFPCLMLTTGLTADLPPQSGRDTDVTVSISLSRPADSAPIKRELLGSQYTFFAQPTKTNIASESLISTWKSMPVTVLRYPGGTWADHYLWDKPNSSYYAVGNAKTVVTPEEFITNCRAVGAEPIIQVNTNMRNSGADFINPGEQEDIQIGADRAARWVREVNLQKKWNVKYWEIGNEVWIWLKPEEYANYVVQYSKAMRAVDPSIKIIACGLSDSTKEFSPDWLKFPDDPNWTPRKIKNNDRDWNQALLDIAAGYFDYIAPHLYIDPTDEKMSANRRFAITNAQIWTAKDLNGQIAWAKKMEGKAKIAVTEWGVNFRQSVPVLRGAGKIDDAELYYFYSLGNGLSTALYFGKMVEASKYIDMAVLHSLDDTMTFYYWPKKEMAKEPMLHPTALAMQIWGRHLGKTPLAMNAKNLPSTNYEGKDYPAFFAYGSEDEKNIYLVAINLDPEKEHDMTLARGQGWAKSPAAATWMKGPRIGSGNFASWGGVSAPEVTLTTDSVPLDNDRWQVKMPAHSMVGLTIPKVL